MVDTTSLPTNWTANHTPTAAEAQTIIDLLTQCAAPPRAKLRRNTSQSINTGTWTAVSWNVQDKLRNMTWSSGTNPTRVTCVVPGAYRITGLVQWDNNSTGTRTINTLVNGTTARGLVRTAATTQPIGIATTVVLDLVAGDYFEIRVWQDSGGTRTLTDNGFADGDAGYLFCEFVGESGS